MNPKEQGSENWNEWRNYVLNELEQFNDKHEKTYSLLTEIQINIAKLEEKAEQSGALYGIITGGAISLIIGVVLRVVI